MPPNSAVAESLLNLLLDRFEAPQARVRDITQPIDYTAIGGPEAQDDFHRVLKDAERTGGIVLEQERLGRFTGEYARVRLKNADSLYGFLARHPSGTIAEAARRRLAEAIPEILEDPFFRAVEQEAYDCWKANRSAFGLAASEADRLITTLKLTHGIVNLSGRDVDHRTFSRRQVKDSKALERSEGRVAQLLKRRNPDLAGDEPREILEACGIVRRAHLLQVKGPLRLSSNSMMMDGTGPLFIGLPWAAVQEASLPRAVDYAITIENPTSFWRFCTEISGNYLALLTDGFPARDVLSSMVHLIKAARAHSSVPLYHWGDIDAGGVRIAAHLEDAFGIPLILHDMHTDLAQKLGSPLQSRKGLDRLSRRAGEIGALARWLSTDRAKALEQEELNPRKPR